MNAASAGLAATHTIAKETVLVMQEKGIDIREHFPKDFERGWASRYDVIVNASGFELPAVDGPEIVEWMCATPTERISGFIGKCGM